MGQFKFDIHTELIDEKRFLAFNNAITEHPLLIKYLNDTAKNGKKILEKILPRNTKKRYYKTTPLHLSLKVGKIQNKKFYSYGDWYKNPTVPILFKRYRAYFGYAIAGRRKDGKGGHINYKYSWPYARPVTTLLVWSKTKQKHEQNVRAVVEEIMTQLRNDIRLFKGNAS